MEKKKKKYYAVANGRRTGIFLEWFGRDGAEIQIKAFPNARYRGFYTEDEARQWLKNPAYRSTRCGLKTENAKNCEERAAGPSALTCAGKVVIHTDGGCINNPGPGGYGAVLMEDGERKELSGGFRLTTNNRMELMACIVALKSLKANSAVIVCSDSRYVVNAVTKGWAKRWRQNDWKRNKTDSAENADLWAQLLDLCDMHSAEFVWVKGHAGNIENERCDQLASQAVAKKKLFRDHVYEKGGL
jgi:ribonuclease HI